MMQWLIFRTSLYYQPFSQRHRLTTATVLLHRTEKLKLQRLGLVALNRSRITNSNGIPILMLLYQPISFTRILAVVLPPVRFSMEQNRDGHSASHPAPAMATAP